jgi:hypothetical protein
MLKSIETTRAFEFVLRSARFIETEISALRANLVEKCLVYSGGT